MWVYVSIAILLVASLIIDDAFRKKTVRSFLFSFLFLVLFLVAGFRSHQVGSDSRTYRYIYESFEYGGIFRPTITAFFTGRMEYGYLLWNQFLYQFNSHYSLLFASTSFLTLLFYFYPLKKLSKNLFFSLILFFGYRFFTFSMSSIRASFSIALCLFAYYLFIKEKKLLCFLAIVLAGSFHLSAFLFLLLFVVDAIPWKRKWILFSFITTLFISINMQRFIYLLLQVLNRYSGYGIFVQINLASILNFLIIACTFILGMFYLQKGVSLQLLRLHKLMYINLLIAILAIQVPMFGRINLLFGSLMMLYIPDVVHQIPSAKKRFFLTAGISTIALANFFIILILRPEWNILLPYESVLQNLFY